MELDKVLGEDSSFTNLTKREREILRAALRLEMERRGELKTYKQIREIVPIENWVDSEYYLGPNYVRLYDYWKELLYEIYRSDRKKEDSINEVVLSGSLGIGKSTVAIIILLRKFYELSCYKNVNALFNLMSTSSIVFLYFSLNKNQANLTGFGDMLNMLDSIPYFRENFPRNTKINSIILMPENIMMTYGSGSQHSIGMNLLGSILDEANFFRGESKLYEASGTKASKVGELYSSIVSRSKSRFVQEGGIDHSISILVSSATHSSSFTEQRIKAAENDKHVIVRTPTLWEVKPKAYSGKKFFVYKGTPSMEPFIVDSVDDVNHLRVNEGMRRSDTAEPGDENIESIRGEINKLPENLKVSFLEVPVELKKSFDTNIMQALQDIGGVSTAPVGRLFTSIDVYNKNCTKDFREDHPFVSTSFVISTGDYIRVSDYLKKGFRFRDLHKPRFLHIDQSAVSDCTGLACVYVDSFYRDEELVKPIVGVDFMIQILPPRPPKRIAIYKIRDFIVYLNRYCGLKIGRLSYDIWGSEESRQILEEMGYNVAYQSVDRNDKAYTDFINLLYEERVRMYDYAPAKKELFALVHDRERRKVDHPKKNDDDTVGCFLGDTKIKLLYGKDIKIEDLVGKEGEWIYGCLENGIVVPVTAKKVFLSKYVNRYVKATLNNGEVIKCTPEHRFMLRDGSYKEAQYLTENDSLMSLNSSSIYKFKFIETVYCDNDIPVYDIEVPLTNNFALSAGVFVHNSKDVMDALVGAVQNLLITPFSEHYDGISDFRKANPLNYPAYINEGNRYQREGTLSELIDAEIDRMLDEYML